ncbi:Nucleotidyltransferase [Dothidotthia symphoricarpi CBS 119687]|uniref:DNA polymerase n=1 Tax=Dothidotthia symphoricarpi CBS 119687 TaxID=1392245 RepID=A0A6A6A5F2_9PLEO|nr:Nucleotidyltransferase [Dothidotthia symphoricarpi CBS 119687]KAF2125998.1 Nucleotidyltransferase [Dothidotthia symphoricarpi CBS 119687]
MISRPGLDLSTIPPIAILTAHLKDDEERQLKETLHRFNAPLTTDVSRAKVFIGKVGTKRRAEFELRSRKLRIGEIVTPKRPASPVKTSGPPNKRRRVSGRVLGSTLAQEGDSETEDEDVEGTEIENEALAGRQGRVVSSSPTSDAEFTSLLDVFEDRTEDDIVWVIKLNWIETCVSEGHLVPLGDNLVYKARVLERPKSKNTKSIKAIFSAVAKTVPVTQTQTATRPLPAQNILDRAKSDASTAAPTSKYKPQRFGNHASRRFEGKTFASSTQPAIPSFAAQTAHLLQKTTSEYEGVDSDTPQPPDWVKKNLKYSCQRFTPANGPNEDFIEQLKKIRTARTLIDDDVGVRAYSSIIAAIAAYPHKLSHPRELAQLPGCDEKSAVLFVEWKNTGKIQAVEDFENDEAMKILRSFYDIWGVGAKTARHFYYQNHWTDLDDIIEFGWNDLDRVQQIGVKYYDEFLVPIPRPEVEHIASVVREHAVRLRDERITVTIVGGYRRGKAASGDVDLIVSHPDLECTAGLVKEIVESLEQTEWITHTLTMSLKNTHRGQQTLPFRSAKGAGAGFDTLDKALVVWQDPTWPGRHEDADKKNPNIHRRVDIIVAPWRTVGCAVLGWSGGTTFQRDLRRYAKAVKEWKFDSSGVRSRGDGEVVVLEGPEGVSGTPEDAEKVVFEGLGLEFVPPEYRVTY